ncbi:Dyp-type peroxidase [Streptomyces millisiae]|uniref:Dyp-type peroxidase n=1 Tax=Streptomyces millisiae TaxID=3075542 RepID=A0ABU2LKB6_9ACTN|nr:Dyp-type peroxidase [Streptomyces sp. DSM 44918]MDT0317533.1 Dyp-type peroxidase [Streptomyces sp. DSM 44918]
MNDSTTTQAPGTPATFGNGASPATTLVPTPPGAPGVIPAQAADRALPLRRSTEIQGDILAGFRKDHVRLLLLTFGNQRGARGWLDRLRHRIATTRDVAAFNAAFSRARHNSAGDDPSGLRSVWRSVSFTHDGLTLLIGGAPCADVPRGSTQEAFAQGMAKRAELLGDTGQNDPAHWLFGGRRNAPVHAVLTVAADRSEELSAALAHEREEIARHGLAVAFEQNGATLEGERRGKEHFGFKDGISQPAVAGFDEPDPEHPEHQRGKPGTRIIAAGEFVVGHPTDHRLPSWLPEWMNDGSFHVVRRLAQDVPGWWAQVADQLRALKERGAVPEEATTEWLAARLVGRWRSGAPVAKSPDADVTAAPGAEPDNDISFDGDFEGRVTPLCSHIRKVNPRDGLTVDAEAQEPLALKGALDGRRIMRRGIPYGLPFDPAGGAGNGPDAPRGLLFVSYQADLIAQFEFVQRTWVDSGDFPSREKPVGRDAMIGREGVVSFPTGGAEGGDPVELSLRQFVRTEGAVYAFAPSLSALERLAKGTVPVGGGPAADRVLTAVRTLQRGEVVSTRKARLRFEADGDLVVRDENETERWRAGAAGLGAVRAELRADGRLMLADSEGGAVWSAPAEPSPGSTLEVLTDGDVLIRAADGTVLWSTGTAR